MTMRPMMARLAVYREVCEQTVSSAMEERLHVELAGGATTRWTALLLEHTKDGVEISSFC